MKFIFFLNFDKINSFSFDFVALLLTCIVLPCFLAKIKSQCWFALLSAPPPPFYKQLIPLKLYDLVKEDSHMLFTYFCIIKFFRISTISILIGFSCCNKITCFGHIRLVIVVTFGNRLKCVPTTLKKLLELMVNLKD